MLSTNDYPFDIYAISGNEETLLVPETLRKVKNPWMDYKYISMTDKNAFVEYVTEKLLDTVKNTATNYWVQGGVWTPILNLSDEEVQTYREGIRRNVEAYYDKLKIQVPSGKSWARYMNVYADSKSLKNWIQ